MKGATLRYLRVNCTDDDSSTAAGPINFTKDKVTAGKIKKGIRQLEDAFE